MDQTIKTVLDKNQGEPEFLQAVEEVYESVLPVLDKKPIYRSERIFERMTEPERIISFRVCWEDDKQEVQINRGFRVQFNSAIGPYKGGLRFHPTVNHSILKFLGFEQIFKNALTGIAMGGGKGGSDFDPKGKSDREVMRFCQAFMSELSHHIGHRIDVPAGDIGVGAREIGYMFGAYKMIKNEFSGALTGKGIHWGGSLIRPEATGYGLIFFAQDMLQTRNDSMEGKACLVSGSGNVAQYAMQKILQLGGKPLTCSDSSGFIYDEEGINVEKLEFIKDLKNVKRGRIKEYADEFKSAVYTPVQKDSDHNPLWDHNADCAFPCATQNEANEKDAENMVRNGISLVAEGANMPISNEGIKVLIDSGVMYAPGKASNAGGVATSGLEMAQNYYGLKWSADQVEEQLRKIMSNVHDSCLKSAEQYGMKGNYQAGANISGFTKVADSMLDQGII